MHIGAHWGAKKSVGHGGGRIERIEDAGGVCTLHNLRPYYT